MSYQVVYRTGGTLNFRWLPIFERYTSVADAQPKVQELNKMGYPTKVIPAGSPIPTTYDA